MNKGFLALLGCLSLLIGCGDDSSTSASEVTSSSSSLLFLSSAEEPQWSQGNGTESDPYIIKTTDDLEDLSTNVSQGRTFEGVFFKLAADISLSGISSWTPIGIWGEDELGWGNKPFRGTFDGDNFTISNLRVNNTSSNYVGLFGLTKNAVIKNLNLKNIDFSGNKIVGGLVAKSDSTQIMNCEIDVSISGQERVGGLIGEMIDGSVSNVLVKGSVEGKSTVGGLVGLIGSRAIVSGSNQANVTGTLQNTGGISGTVSGGSISDASNTGLVVGVLNVGGISGNVTMAGQIAWSSNTTKITASGTNSFVGGIVGDLASNSVLESSYNLGEISSTGNYAAGIVGKITGSEVHDIFNHGTISAVDYVGGLVAKCGENAVIKRGYNKGSVSVTKHSASLLAETLSTTTYFNLFYDNVLAMVSLSEEGGMSSDDMTSTSFTTVLNAGEVNVWTWETGIMSNYPFLSK